MANATLIPKQQGVGSVVQVTDADGQSVGLRAPDGTLLVKAGTSPSAALSAQWAANAASYAAYMAKYNNNNARLNTLAQQAAQFINTPANFAALNSALNKIATTASLTAAEKTAFLTMFKAFAEMCARLWLHEKMDDAT